MFVCGYQASLIKSKHIVDEGIVLPLLNTYITDVIILKTWVPLEMVKHCFPVRTLLLPPSEKAAWQGMKTVAQVKKSKGIKNLANPDSLYTVRWD